MKFRAAELVLGICVAWSSWAVPVKVGNANDGRDLENLSPVTQGPLLDSRQAAITLLTRVNTAGIPGLGNLLPEVEKAALFVAAEDVKASISDDLRPDHLSNDGRVYARTMAEPYAPTRFFPVSTTLTSEQLAALHIHEALHRSLAKSVREDEAVVAKMTLTITTPGATFDSVREVAAQILPVTHVDRVTNRDLMPSQVGYQMRFFFNSADSGTFAVRRAHLFQSYLYPFGDEESPFGLGLEASVIERNDAVVAGPLGVTARFKILSKRDFQIDITAGVDLNTLSGEELKHSPYGRDIFKTGIIIRKDLGHFYVENALEISSGGKSTDTIGNVAYTYAFGQVVKPSIHVGGIYGAFHFGSFIDIFLADHFRVNGGSFDDDKGRYRIIAIGPEVQFNEGNWILGLAGRFLVNSTKDTDFNTLGNVLDSWVGKGGIQLSAAYRF